MIASDIVKPSLQYVGEPLAQAVVVEDAQQDDYDELREEYDELRFVLPEPSVIQEAVAVAVREEINRIEQHDEFERLVKAVGIVHNAGQPEDTRHNGNDQALKVLAERRHRGGRP